MQKGVGDSRNVVLAALSACDARGTRAAASESLYNLRQELLLQRKASVGIRVKDGAQQRAAAEQDAVASVVEENRQSFLKSCSCCLGHASTTPRRSGCCLLSYEGVAAGEQGLHLSQEFSARVCRPRVRQRRKRQAVDVLVRVLKIPFEGIRGEQRHLRSLVQQQRKAQIAHAFLTEPARPPRPLKKSAVEKKPGLRGLARLQEALLAAGDELQTLHLSKLRGVAEEGDEENLGHVALAVRAFVLRRVADTAVTTDDPLSLWIFLCISLFHGWGCEEPTLKFVRILAHSFATTARSSAALLQARTWRMNSRSFVEDIFVDCKRPTARRETPLPSRVAGNRVAAAGKPNAQTRPLSQKQSFQRVPETELILSSLALVCASRRAKASADDCAYDALVEALDRSALSVQRNPTNIFRGRNARETAHAFAVASRWSCGEIERLQPDTPELPRLQRQRGFVSLVQEAA